MLIKVVIVFCSVKLNEAFYAGKQRQIKQLTTTMGQPAFHSVSMNSPMK